jgi:hypothetical protein
MFQPVGPQRASVYWRRRLVLLASVVLILILLITLIRAMTSSAAPAAVGTSSTSASSTPPRHAATSRVPRQVPPIRASTTVTVTASATSTATATGSAAASSGSPSASKSAPPQPCASSQLRIAALSAQERYALGSKPVLGMQVTNAGTAPCVQDFSDQQVLLQIYNGQARVWGSHDCGVHPGSNVQTLPAGRPVRVEMTWSGRTSQPHCAGGRERAGVGTYTLYASLAGHPGTAATFTMS